MLRTGWAVVRRMGAAVLVVEADGDGLVGDVDGDDLAGVDPAEGDLLPDDHDDPAD
jgi:hypothetical protein